jgi:hypothetical protein
MPGQLKVRDAAGEAHEQAAMGSVPLGLLMQGRKLGLLYSFSRGIHFGVADGSVDHQAPGAAPASLRSWIMGLRSGLRVRGPHPVPLVVRTR